MQAGTKPNPTQMRIALLTLDQIAAEQGKAPDETRHAEEDALKKQLPETMGATDADSSSSTLAMGAPDTQDRAPMAARARMPVLQKPAMSSEMAATLAQLRQLAASSLLNVGTVLARRQDYAGAVVAFKYAAAEDPTMDPVTRNLGLAAYVSGSYDDSAQALKQVVAAHPDDATAREFLGMAEFEIGEYSDAAAAFTSLGDALSTKPLVAATAAATFARTGDRTRADQAMAALKNAPADPQLQARESVAYLDLGDADHATEAANAALTGGQNSAEALRVLGLLALERGDAAKAAGEFQDACKAEHVGSKNQLECQALLAVALTKSGKKSAGEDLIANVTSANPKLADALAQRAASLLKNGDAQAAYEKSAAAFALAPRDKEIRAKFEAAKRAVAAH
jgi:tetratricopeptide (TPR) repeat protein